MIWFVPYPDHDRSVVAAGHNNLLHAANEAGGVRSKLDIPTTPELIGFGRKLWQGGLDGQSPCARAEGVRDGLMILFLAQYPLRLKNFANLEIGKTLRKVGDIWCIRLPGEDVKSHRPIIRKRSVRPRGLTSSRAADHPRG